MNPESIATVSTITDGHTAQIYTRILGRHGIFMLDVDLPFPQVADRLVRAG